MYIVKYPLYYQYRPTVVSRYTVLMKFQNVLFYKYDILKGFL